MLADVSSWRAPFAVLASAALALMVFGARILPALGGHVAERRAERALAIYARVLSEPNHLRAFVLVACATFASFLIVPYIAPYMVRNVGVAERNVALMYFFGGFATFFSARWIGRQIDLRGKQRMFRILGIASIVPMLAITHLPAAPLWVAIGVGVLFMVLVSGRYVPVMSIVNAAGAAGMRGSYLSLSGAVQQTAAGSASLVAGTILGATATGELTRFNWVGVIAAGAMLVAIAWAGRVRAVS